MSRFFASKKDLNFISDLTKEITRDVVGQFLTYFPISEIKTKVHLLYNEAQEKIYDNPIRIPALVSMSEGPLEVNIYGTDYVGKLEAFVQYNDLIDNNINLSLGDFVKWGDSFYEIVGLTKLRNLFGHMEETNGYKLECTQVRQGQFVAPVEVPTDRQYTDDSAVVAEFEQSRGYETVNGELTGDVRALRENGTLEEPINGPKKIVFDPVKGSKFYDE